MGAHFIDFADIHLEPNERPKDLYQRFIAFVEDLLLKANSFSHHGDLITEDEELTPTLENVVVLTWLQLIHPKLPKLVKQRYGTELRSRTLASIKTEVSQALKSLLDEIRATDDARVMRTATNTFRKTSPIKAPPNRGIRSARQTKSCPLCKQAGHPGSNHFLSECRHLPEVDRKYIAKARQIANIFDDHLQNNCKMAPRADNSAFNDEDNSLTCNPEPTVLRIQTRQSPSIISSVAGKIRIPILSSEPRSLKRNEHFCQVCPVFTPDIVATTTTPIPCEPCPQPTTPSAKTRHSSNLSLDPGNALTQDIRAKFQELYDEYDEVFDPHIIGYNGASGPLRLKLTWAPSNPRNERDGYHNMPETGLWNFRKSSITLRT